MPRDSGLGCPAVLQWLSILYLHNEKWRASGPSPRSIFVYNVSTSKVIRYLSMYCISPYLFNKFRYSCSLLVIHLLSGTVPSRVLLLFGLLLFSWLASLDHIIASFFLALKCDRNFFFSADIQPICPLILLLRTLAVRAPLSLMPRTYNLVMASNKSYITLISNICRNSGQSSK